MPTASAVVADVMDAARNKDRPKYLDWGPGEEHVPLSPDDVVRQWYVRAEGSAEALRSTLGEVTVLARAGAPAGEAAVLTRAMTRKELESKLFSIPVHTVFRLLED